MIRQTLIALSLTVGSTVVLDTPAQAAVSHTHYCNCGHTRGKSQCGTSTTTTSGGTTTTSGGTTTSTSGGTTTTSGGTTTSSSTSSGGTSVPEPGMLGLMGMGLLGVAYARRRRTRA